MKRFFFEIWENIYYIFLFRGEYFSIKRRSKLRRKNKIPLKTFFWWTFGLAVTICLILLGYKYPAVGFSEFTSLSGEYFRGKTLWDWIELAIVPIVIALLAYWLSGEQKLKEIEIAQLHKREETLQKYFDQITSLLIDQDLLAEDKQSTVATLAKARTITTLDMLDSRQKGHLIRFLSELGLIDSTEPKIDLRRGNLSHIILEPGNYDTINLGGTNLDNAEICWCSLENSDMSGCSIQFADLEEIDLFETDLNYVSFYKSDLYNASLKKSQLLKANFEDTNLAKANLEEASIRSGNFKGSNLQQTVLKNAYLAFADFSFSNLRDADLSGADLNHANFNGANLRNSILDQADLTNAIITKRQLKQAKSTKGAKL